MKKSYLQSSARIALSSIVSAGRDQVSSFLDEEAVILHLKSGIYYGLNPLGARIWELVQESTVVRDVKDTLLQEYVVSADRCQRYLLSLLEELRAARLIEVRDNSAGA